MKKGNLPLANMRLTRTIGAIAASLTGASVIYSIAYPQLSAIMPSALAGFISAAIVAAVIYLVDWGMLREFPYSLNYALGGKAKSTKAIVFISIMFFVMALRIATSGWLSWEGRKDIASAVVADADIKDHTSPTLAANATLAGITAQFEKDISREEARRKTALERARKSVKKTESMTWNTYNNRVAAAQNKAEKPIDAAISKLRADKAAAIERHQTSTATLLSAISTHNESEMNKETKKITRAERYGGWLGLGGLLIFILYSVIISLVETDSNLANTPTPPVAAPTPAVNNPAAPSQASALFKIQPVAPATEPQQGAGFNIPPPSNQAGFNIGGFEPETQPEIKPAGFKLGRVEPLVESTPEPIEPAAFEWEVQGKDTSPIPPQDPTSPPTLDEIKGVVEEVMDAKAAEIKTQPPVVEQVQAPESLTIEGVKEAMGEVMAGKLEPVKDTSLNPFVLGEEFVDEKTGFKFTVNQETIWVEGFKSSPFTVGLLRKKLGFYRRRHEAALKEHTPGFDGLKKSGSPATAALNVRKFKRAIELMNRK